MFNRGHLVVFKTGKNTCIYIIDEIKSNLVVLKNTISAAKLDVDIDQIREADDIEILLGRRNQK